MTRSNKLFPEDARSANINNGDLVKICNDRGSNLRTAKVTDKTQRHLLVAEGIYWENDSSGQTGINDLTSQEITDLGEGGTFHESRVKIIKVS